MAHFDAVVIGGGPAGLAASIAAARAGLSVLVADVRKPPIDKLCGEGMLPDGLAGLRALGVDLNAARNGTAFEGISFHDGVSSFGAAFPGAAGLGLRRTALHEGLMDAACREGVTLRWQARAEMESFGMVRVAGERVRCRYVMGADGQRSMVRQAAGLSGNAGQQRRRQRLASGQHYACAGWSRSVEVHWAGHTQAYVTPVGPQEVGVAFLSADPDIRPNACLDLFPVLRERLAQAQVIGKAQGATSVIFRIPRVTYNNGAGGVALIGEASGSVDAITGEGLTLLFRQAIALGDALRAGDLRLYEREHRRIMRRARFMSRLLMTLSEYPRWRGHVFRAFAKEPRAFENLLAAHVGQRPRLFGAGGCAPLCGHLLLG